MIIAHFKSRNHRGDLCVIKRCYLTAHSRLFNNARRRIWPFVFPRRSFVYLSPEVLIKRLPTHIMLAAYTRYSAMRDEF